MNYSNTTNSDSVLKDVALLIVRVFIGFAMLSHGFPKLQMLLEGKSDFFDFLGLFSRISLGFLMFTMIIAGFVVHGADPFEKREMSLIYLSVYLLLMVFGVGKFSVDYMIEKRKRTNDW